MFLFLKDPTRDYWQFDMLHSSRFPVDTHRLYQLKILWTKIVQIELLEHVLLTPLPQVHTF